MDSLHLCIALGPVAMYLLVLGAINLSPRPFVTTGGRDLAALGIAIGGFVIAGPMELFLPERAVASYGGWVWAMMVACYVLLVTFVALTVRPRLVIYNCTAEQILPALAAVGRLDPTASAAGASLTLPQLGVALYVETTAMTKNVQIVASGPDQSLAGWRSVEQELSAALAAVPGSPNPYGASLLSFGVALAGIITWMLARDPSAVQQALNDMLRQ
ncbi:MAG: hypothetical protein WD872_06415 [Pirellulaceae bacterium]